MRKILSSLLVLGITSAIVVGLSSAFFSDTETSTGNVLQAGELDLKIDNESYYNGILQDGDNDTVDTTWDLEDLTDQLFFNFTDIKPDDYGEDTISLHAQNDYWACMDIEVTRDDDNTCTEPELEDDPDCNEPNNNDFDGELGELVNFIWWVDDGDNVLEDDEQSFINVSTASEALNQSITLADSSQNLFEEDGPLSPEQTYYIGKAWCFGELGTAPISQDGAGDQINPAGDNNNNNTQGEPEDGGFTCDGTTINNASQTDVLMGDISFAAFQARNNDSFLCNGINCEEQEVWADSVEEEDQGDRKDGSDVLASRSDPETALGEPDGDGSSSTGFYSLGFGGSITIKFAQIAGNIEGDDLSIHEITNSRQSYPLEQAKVEVSQDGSTWHELTERATSQKTEGGDGVTLLDIDETGLDWFQYVRITDETDPDIHNNTADGFDLDAVDAQSVCTQDSSPENVQ